VSKQEFDTGFRQESPDYVSEIVAAHRGGFTPGQLREKLLSYHENDLAASLDLITKAERSRLYNLLDVDTLSDILEYSGAPETYLMELELPKRVDILSRLDPAIATEYLCGLQKDERSTLLELLDDDARREIALFSSFEDDEIGCRMTTNFISVHTGITIREAMKQLVEQAAENDNISTIYVLDQNDRFFGAIDLKDLIIARDSKALAEITKASYPYFYATERIEDCMERIRNYSEDSIPVLDKNHRMLGVLISQDMTQMVDDELGDDYAKLAGLTTEEDLSEPLRKSMLKRLPWLAILLGLGLLVSGVVGAFETVVASLTLIVSFQSLVLGMAGNAGTQSLGVTIRILMDERISQKQKLQLVGKEARVGFLNGLILGVLSFGLIGVYLMLFKEQSAKAAFSISMCTGIALSVSILLSSITGTVIPLGFKKLNIDPAVASGPLITTINDLVAVVSYYGLAWLLLIGTIS